jgi:hypothetical protein
VSAQLADILPASVAAAGVLMAGMVLVAARRPARGQHSDRLDVTSPEPRRKGPGQAAEVVDLPVPEATPADAGWATCQPRPYAPSAREAAPLLAAPVPPEPIPDGPLPIDVPPGSVPPTGDEPEPLDVPDGPPVPDEGGAAQAEFPHVFEPSQVLARARDMLGDAAREPAGAGSRP